MVEQESTNGVTPETASAEPAEISEEEKAAQIKREQELAEDTALVNEALTSSTSFADLPQETKNLLSELHLLAFRQAKVAFHKRWNNNRPEQIFNRINVMVTVEDETTGKTLGVFDALKNILKMFILPIQLFKVH